MTENSKVIEVNGVKFYDNMIKVILHYQENNFTELDSQCEYLSDLICNMCKLIGEMACDETEKTVLEVTRELALLRDFFKSFYPPKEA